MCMKVYCDQCGLITWKGCGQHVAQVLKNVPAEERCQCQKEQSAFNIVQTQLDSFLII